MDVERTVSDRTGCYSNPNNEYTRDIEGKNDGDLDYKQNEIASEHDAESRVYLDPSTRYQSHVCDDEDDLNDGLPFQVHSSRTTGRDRRGMYVPAYEDGPMLGDSSVGKRRVPSGDCDNFSGSGDSELRSDRKPLVHFEKVFNYPPGVVSQQSERAETETISSPLPRQLVLKGGSKSFNEDTPSPLMSTSSPASPFASPSVDRGESLVIESGKRCEITIKPKSSNAKIDSSHGSKYQSVSSISSNDGEKPSGGKNQTNRGRPRRTRNDAVPVVNAVVSDVRKVIHAQVIEVKEKESRRDDTFSDESEIFHSAEKLRKLEYIISNISQQRGEVLSPEDEDPLPVPETQESFIVEDELKESDLPMEEETNSAIRHVQFASALDMKEEEIDKIDDDLGMEYDKNNDQTKITGEFDKTTAVAIVLSPLVASDGEDTTPSEGNFHSNLQRQGSIRPHPRKPKENRRKVTPSQLQMKKIQTMQTEEHETLKSSQVKSTNALKLTDLTSLSSSTSQRMESVRVKTGSVELTILLFRFKLFRFL